jgi:hypothetical protein
MRLDAGNVAAAERRLETLGVGQRARRLRQTFHPSRRTPRRWTSSRC